MDGMCSWYQLLLGGRQGSPIDWVYTICQAEVALYWRLAEATERTIQTMHSSWSKSALSSCAQTKLGTWSWGTAPWGWHHAFTSSTDAVDSPWSSLWSLCKLFLSWDFFGSGRCDCPLLCKIELGALTPAATRSSNLVLTISGSPADLAMDSRLCWCSSPVLSREMAYDCSWKMSFFKAGQKFACALTSEQWYSTNLKPCCCSPQRPSLFRHASSLVEKGLSNSQVLAFLDLAGGSVSHLCCPLCTLWKVAPPLGASKQQVFWGKFMMSRIDAQSHRLTVTDVTSDDL